jgi:anti-sigma factor RsiW
MLNPNHPDDARLSALASQDADAVGDASLAEHLASCARCATLTEELGALRANLAALPDLAPQRPLRLIPDAAATRPDRLGEWVRKVFGPVMAAGAAIALVGMVGTVAPSLSSSAALSAGQADSATERAALERSSAEAVPGEVDSLNSGGPFVAQPGENDGTAGAEEPPRDSGEFNAFDQASERSPWPMVLFAGVALLIAAALLRWILVPRAG